MSEVRTVERNMIPHRGSGTRRVKTRDVRRMNFLYAVKCNVTFEWFTKYSLAEPVSNCVCEKVKENVHTLRLQKY